MAQIPFVETVGATTGAATRVILPLGTVPPGTRLELTQFSVFLGTSATLLTPRLLVNGREETRARLGPAAAAVAGHPAFRFPAGVFIEGGSTLEIDFDNTTGAGVTWAATLAGTLHEKA